MARHDADFDSDWFRLETMDDSLQPTIDMLLNLAIFMWFGAVCPWSSFLNNNIIPIYRLIFLGVLILLVRRMPIIFAMHKYIGQIEHLLQAAFVGFFGPIGVGAIFYLSVCREFLQGIIVDGKVRDDAQKVSEAVDVVVWFLVICSIVNRTLTFQPLLSLVSNGHTGCAWSFYTVGESGVSSAADHFPRTQCWFHARGRAGADRECTAYPQHCNTRQQSRT